MLRARDPDENDASAAGRAIAPETRLRGRARLRELARRGGRELGPWLALCALWLLFELPRAVQSTVPHLSALRCSLEPPLLITAWALNEAWLRSRALAAALWTALGVLIVLRIDFWICLLLLHDEPLLYDQWFMARHLGVLIGDLMSWLTALVLLGIAIGAWLVARLARWLFARGRALWQPGRRARTKVVAAVLWGALLAASVALRAEPDPPVRWWTPALIDNVARSRAVYRSVQRGLERSPYAAYDQLALCDRPDVLLFIVESYGRVLSVEPETSPAHAALLAELSTELSRAGWHAVSAFSAAPISGGRSWIAEGAMLMGTPIHYEAVFQHVVSLRPRNLVGFLNRQGYETVLLAPADRNRPGAYVVNRYGFTRLLTFEQLGYRGPHIGWGIVPDQFSLAVAEQRVLRTHTRPVFLDFHMVSSHAPWRDVPELTTTLDAPAGSAAPTETTSDARAVITRLRRYGHLPEGRDTYLGHFDTARRSGYQATITYDLRLIARYLARRAEDALVIVLGDHQPPVISRSDASFDVPVHVLSRAPDRLEELIRQGFARGLALPPHAPPALAHAALFSLVARTLCAGCASCTPPPLLRQGDALLAE